MNITISPRENFTMAMGAVWTNRFRSMLTILGIVIGITTVVTVASLLTGLRAGVVTFFDELGPDNVFLFKTSGDPGQSELMAPLKERKRHAIDPNYADVIRRTANTVESVGTLIYIPPAPSGTIITAKVPGFETDSLSMVGASPNTEWLSGLVKLDGKGFVITGSGADGASSPFATSRPGIFAVGDVRAGSVKRVASSVGEGSVVISKVWEYINP